MKSKRKRWRSLRALGSVSRKLNNSKRSKRRAVKQKVHRGSWWSVSMMGEGRGGTREFSSTSKSKRVATRERKSSTSSYRSLSAFKTWKTARIKFKSPSKVRTTLNRLCYSKNLCRTRVTCSIHWSMRCRPWRVHQSIEILKFNRCPCSITRREGTIRSDSAWSWNSFRSLTQPPRYLEDESTTKR